MNQMACAQYLHFHSFILCFFGFFFVWHTCVFHIVRLTACLFCVILCLFVLSERNKENIGKIGNNGSINCVSNNNNNIVLLNQ